MTKKPEFSGFFNLLRYNIKKILKKCWQGTRCNVKWHSLFGRVVLNFGKDAFGVFTFFHNPTFLNLLERTMTTVKKTKITLHIPTGTKKADGKNKQDHIVLWNNEANLDIFFGGIAEVVETEKGRDLKVVTKPVEVNGKTYNNAAQPFVAFVNRFPDGNVSNVVVRKGAEKGKTVCELAFTNKGEKGQFASGFFNANGLVYEETGKVSKAGKPVLRVNAKDESNVRMTAEFVGGNAQEIYAALYSKDKAEAAKK